MAETFPIFVQSVELSVTDEPHPYHVQNAEIALEAWQDEVAKKPLLFNGLVFLERELNFTGDRLAGISHLLPYSTLLHWLQNNEGEGDHLFALGLIISKEGFPLLGRMAEYTFNGGKCYAPSGSLDADDIENGKINLLANIERELGEETGLDLSKADIENGFHVFRHGRKTIPVTRCKFDLSAADLCKQINSFIGNDPEAELSEVFAVEEKQHYAENLAEYMIEILNWHFDTI